MVRFIDDWFKLTGTDQVLQENHVLLADGGDGENYFLLENVTLKLHFKVILTYMFLWLRA